MANTYVDYTATAGQTDFNFSFPYLQDDHVEVLKDGTEETGFTIALSPTRIVLNVAATGGEAIRIRRSSDPTVNLVDFENGSVLTENELDLAYRHNRYLNEEAFEGNTSSLQTAAGSSNFDANFNKIVNLATPTNSLDAANKDYVDDKLVLSGTSLSGFNKSVHTGDNTTTQFTLSFTAQTGTAAAFRVAVDGVLQTPDDAYTINTGTNQITFTSAPPTNAEIVVIATGTAQDVNSVGVTATGSTTARSLANRFADVVNVLDYGAYNDGTDASSTNLTNIKAAVSALPASGGVLVFPYGTYLIEAEAYGINLNGKSNFKIVGNGSLIKIKDSQANVANGVLMWFEECTSGVVEDLILDCNLPTRTGSNTSGEHCLKIRSGSDLLFNNVTAKNALSDGFYLDTLTPATASTIPTDITFKDCVADACYRNGLSAIQSLRLKVSGGSYKNSSGQLPQAGIDLEDDGTAGNIDTVIENCSFLDNTSTGIQASGVFGCDNVTIQNCYFKGNGEEALSIGSCRGVNLFDLNIGEHTYTLVAGNFRIGQTYEIVTVGTTDFTLIGSADNNIGTTFTATGAGTGTGTAVNTSSRGIIDFLSTGVTDNVAIKNVTFRDCIAGEGTSKACIYMHSNNTGHVDIDGISIYDSGGTGLDIQCPLVSVQNVYMYNQSGSGYSASINSDHPTVRNISLQSCRVFIFASGSDNAMIDGFSSLDATSNTNLWFNNNNGGGTAKNISVIKTSGVASSVGVLFAQPPTLVSNVSAKTTTGTNFDGSNVVQFSGGLNDDTILKGITPGHWTKDKVSSDQGDNDITLTRGLNPQTIRFNTGLSQARTITFSTTNARSGDKWRIVRGSIGSFDLNVGAGTPLLILVNNEWVDVQYNGTAWIVTGHGSTV